MEPAIVACLIIAFIFWLIRVARIVVHFFKLLEIRAFYKNALRITEVGTICQLKKILLGLNMSNLDK